MSTRRERASAPLVFRVERVGGPCTGPGAPARLLVRCGCLAWPCELRISSPGGSPWLYDLALNAAAYFGVPPGDGETGPWGAVCMLAVAVADDGYARTVEVRL